MLCSVDVWVQKEVSQYWFPAKASILATMCVPENCVPTNREPSPESLLEPAEPRHSVLCNLGPDIDMFQTTRDS